MNQQRFLITSTDKAFMISLIDFLNVTKVKPGSTTVRLMDELDGQLPELIGDPVIRLTVGGA